MFGILVRALDHAKVRAINKLHELCARAARVKYALKQIPFVDYYCTRDGGSAHLGVGTHECGFNCFPVIEIYTRS